MVAALVLAAGESTRMGVPKALLPVSEGRPFVATIVRTLTAADVAPVVVVTGGQHSAVVDALAADRLAVQPLVVRNEDPSRGQLSSIWTGLEAVARPELEALLVTLVDIPMFRVETVRSVVEQWRLTGAPIVRPAVGPRHGHPVLFDRGVFDALRRAPLAEGAKAVLREYAERVVDVQVDDPGCVEDVDTPEEYRALIDRTRSTRPG